MYFEPNETYQAPQRASQMYVRANDIATTRRKSDKGTIVSPGLLSISLSHWWALVKAQKAPQPIKLSSRCTVWRRDDVIRFAESMGNGESA